MTRQWRRLPLAGAAAIIAALAWSHHAQAATWHRAALVIEHGSGAVMTRCVSFVEDQISGLQLIQRSGVEYQVQQFGSMGSAICQLDDEPSQVPSGCFGSGPYWQYFHRTGSGWAQSGEGASTWMVHDGGVEGWHYAAGADQVPANMTFSTVCAAPTPAPTTPVTVSTPKATVATSGRAAAIAPTIAPTPASTSELTPTGSSSPRAEALAASDSPKPRLLANTGPQTHPDLSPGLGVWALLGGSAVLLLGLLGLNLWRRGP